MSSTSEARRAALLADALESADAYERSGNAKAASALRRFCDALALEAVPRMPTNEVQQVSMSTTTTATAVSASHTTDAWARLGERYPPAAEPAKAAVRGGRRRPVDLNVIVLDVLDGGRARALDGERARVRDEESGEDLSALFSRDCFGRLRRSYRTGRPVLIPTYVLVEGRAFVVARHGREVPARVVMKVQVSALFAPRPPVRLSAERQGLGARSGLRSARRLNGAACPATEISGPDGALEVSPDSWDRTYARQLYRERVRPDSWDERVQLYRERLIARGGAIFPAQ